ncbi:MAG: hypothetical protein ABIZ81_15150 [Opitutaceae bacterium]
MIFKRSRSFVNGFTLLEVMLAATVMLGGIVGMMHVITSGSEMLDASRKQTIATQIMHGEIERIRITDWAQIVALVPPYPAQQTQQGYSEANAARIVQWIPDDSPTSPNRFRFTRTLSYNRSDLTQIAVSYTVNWTGNTGHSYTRSTSTYVGKNGLYVAYQR